MNRSDRILVMGTHNQGKRRELEILLRPLGFELKTLNDFPNSIDVDETGTTFRENAILKATTQAKHLRQWVLGEDSGLSVDALQGAPGVYSARFAGQHGDDTANNNLLLSKLASVAADQRGAAYTCHIALSDPSGNIHVDCFGTCRGRITEGPRGTGGFGYDPLFELVEYRLTFGELGSAVKSVLSHRACALREFARQLRTHNIPDLGVA
ncbi:MAG TPA: RdgB/HAM1 family non-canonical purine NTP pyrophosphatase [Pirellulaceae bacterium]|nr:RdgB/HAM1 family non-canonical purine NTP pyrophosphatase [Pirellulaceae bacterium]HMO91022.1 RdgB/HAM1 family non-canonical purine NTP pyrophosphatase [Pirellulaceae bacterium]HMP68137.1 RdgB/HAM1 family non-canonical purine NTP pyrophosphatase [Pirellulaceae bacterium]